MNVLENIAPTYQRPERPLPTEGLRHIFEVAAQFNVDILGIIVTDGTMGELVRIAKETISESRRGSFVHLIGPRGQSIMTADEARNVFSDAPYRNSRGEQRCGDASCAACNPKVN